MKRDEAPNSEGLYCCEGLSLLGEGLQRACNHGGDARYKTSRCKIQDFKMQDLSIEDQRTSNH